MVQLDNSCCLRIFKPPPEGELGASPELFAECEVRLENGRTVQVFVEPVIDSSRYFVLRCEDKASGRHAYVGIGFRERSSAFDLKAVLDDFVRFMDRQKRAAETSSVESEEVQGEEGAGTAVRQMKDLSIAEGQKLHIGLKVSSGDGSTRTRRRARTAGGSGENASSSKGGGLGLLAPPPLPGAIYKASPPLVSPPVTPVSATTPNAVPPTLTTPEKQSQHDYGETVSAPKAGEGGGEGTGAGVPDRDVDVSMGSSTASNSRDGGEDNDDDWGDFESA
ncbi:unnamed protein product [Sphacelaria rigidula]